MSLRTLPLAKIKKGTRVLVRVDWNVPLKGKMVMECEKMERTVPLIRELRKRGAITILMTHLGRPKGRDPKTSTKLLIPFAEGCTGIPVEFLDVDFGDVKKTKQLTQRIRALKNGDVVLLENVRFQIGEEENKAALAKKYATLADLFVNDAFASCHRAHASVVGVARELPAYAGPALQDEVSALSKLLQKPKHPYYAFIGGSKLSTKIEVIERLITIADKVFIGGAMAHVFFAAKKIPIGASYIESEGIRLANKLIKKTKKIELPLDLVVAKKIAPGIHPRVVGVGELTAKERIGDIGPETARTWSEMIKQASTVVWNGPVGVTEIPAFSHGSLVLARAMGSRGKGKTFCVAGGGDTLPVIEQSGMGEYIDHVSTGGGAMLEFIALNGKLPGLKPLQIK
jgi:phosphoglycerate kinase